MAPWRLLSTGEALLPMNVSTDPPALADIRSELVFLTSDNIRAEPDLGKLRFAFCPPPPQGVRAELTRNDEKWGQSTTATGDSPHFPSLAQEPQVVELSDGRLMCVMRTGNGCIHFTTSADHGRTWAPSQPLRFAPGGPVIPHPNAPCPFTRLSDGRYALLFCNNDGTGNGGQDPFDHLRNRNPVCVSVGREVDDAQRRDPSLALRVTDREQPLAFTPPRLLCSIEGFRPDVQWRDLTYGYLLENDGEYFHFYNAVWQAIQLNRADPRLLE
jgi:hypothetical protein